MNQLITVLNELEDDVVDHPVENGTPRFENSRKTEITQNKAYIQRKGAFLESTPEKLTDTITQLDDSANSKWNQLPLEEEQNIVDVAILFQHRSHSISNLCYGLLGGISLMQLVLTHTLVKGSKNEIMSFIELYSKFDFVPSASFTILTTLCLMFALDRIDLISIKKQTESRDRHNISNWIILVLYSSMFVLSILCFKYDELIAMYPGSKDAIPPTENLQMWKVFNLWKCIFGIIGWFIICITRPHDFLKLHLCSLRKECNKKRKSKF